ncbi:hypothetical protein ACR53_02395, partial [Bacillus stratosphericus]
PRLQRFSITLKRRQRAKIKFILALCQQSGAPLKGVLFCIYNNIIMLTKYFNWNYFLVGSYILI